MRDVRTLRRWARWVMASGALGLMLASAAGCAMYSQMRSSPREHFWEYYKPTRPQADLYYPDDIKEAGRPGVTAGVPVEAPPPGPTLVPPVMAAGFEPTRESFANADLLAARGRKPGELYPGGAEKQTVPAPETKKRLVIYTAQFSVLVANVEDSMKDLLKKIESWQGYVQTADLKKVTFRVPANTFDRAVQEISQMGVVTNKQIQAEDVTRQFADLELRIQVAETSLKRLLALLEKADKTEDLIKIENEIRRLTEEIERMKGELRNLADRIAYSTITVDFTAKAAEVKRPRPRRTQSYFGWINQIGAENVSRNF